MTDDVNFSLINLQEIILPSRFFLKRIKLKSKANRKVRRINAYIYGWRWLNFMKMKRLKFNFNLIPSEVGLVTKPCQET